MEVFDAITQRRSIRKYSDRKIPDDVLDSVLEAARLAPSSSNTQSWKFKVITDDETRALLKEAAFGQKFIEEAPVVIACCLDFEAFKERGKQALKLVLSGVRPSLEMILRSVRGGKDREYDVERVVINGTLNVAIAVDHMTLAAVDRGLGTCWVRAFEPDAVNRLLNLPEGVTLVALLTLGYPDQRPSARPRKPLEEILL